MKSRFSTKNKRSSSIKENYFKAKKSTCSIDERVSRFGHTTESTEDLKSRN
jgi:hypothetical protein